MPPTSALVARVLARDESADGVLVFGVTTTGIYCRPSCPARRPAPERIRIFSGPGDAAAAGFRACKRCRPDAAGAWRRGDVAADRAADLLRRYSSEKWTLDRLADAVGAHPTRLRADFLRRHGASPRAFLDRLRTRRVKAELRSGATVRRASRRAGYASPSALYDASHLRLGMTPGAYKRGGQALRIRFTTAPTPLGVVLVAATARGICAARLGASAAPLVADLRREFPKATLDEDAAGLAGAVRAIAGQAGPSLGPVALDLHGTSFQRRVWRALQRVPAGATVTYGDLARRIGRPSASRAVARAVASNPVAVLVPCHRVVRGDGGLGGFRWGLARKRALLARERIG